MYLSILFFAEVEIPERKNLKVEELGEEKEDEINENSEKRLYNGYQGPLTEIEDNEVPSNSTAGCSLVHIHKLYHVLLILLHLH